MNVKFLRVMGAKSKSGAEVLAIAEHQRVRWERGGWSCDCPTFLAGTGDDACPHVDAVADLLDDRVLGEAG